jgi:hypothetical protein
VAGRSTRSLAIMEPKRIDTSSLEPNPSVLRLAKWKIQGVIGGFGVIPMWLAIDTASSGRWGFAALWLAIFCAVESFAFWVVPVMAGAARGSERP